MKRLILFITCCWSFLSIGQKTIETMVNTSSVAAYERFTFDIVVNNSDCQISTPDFGELEIVGGPARSQYNSTQFINGVRTQSFEYKWTYQLRAKKEGTYTIPGVPMHCGDETLESEPITITVGKGDENAGVDRDFYMRLSTNKSSVYEGEPFVATLKYFAKMRPESFDALDLGDAVGIYRQDLKPDRTTFETNMESINGVRYYTIELREELCFAQRSGKVTLDPYYASLVFQRDFFNRFRKETHSNAVDITVKKIPGSDRPDFNGLVGDFSVSGEISQDHVKMGDAVDLKITVEGKGNLQALGSIELDFPEEFDEFDPEIVDKTTISHSGISGKIEYNFVIIPKHYGNYTIPGYSFAYFDLDSKKMRTASSPEFTLKVDKREGVDVQTPVIPDQETDIHYIEESSDDFFEQDDFTFGSWTYYSLLLSPIAASLFLVFFVRKKENLSEDDLVKIQQKKAVKIAQTELKEVNKLVENGDDKAALKGLQSVLNNFFKQKFNVGLSDLSQREIESRLAQREVNQDLRSTFNRIWNAIEMGQYAPIAHDNLVQTVKDTEELIIALDKQL